MSNYRRNTMVLNKTGSKIIINRTIFVFHQHIINLSYWSDGTRMIEFIYTCSFVTIFVMLVSSL